MKNKVDELKKLFLHSVSLGDKVDDEILKCIDELLYTLNEYEIDSLRKNSANLSHDLHELGSAVVPYLLLLVLNKLEAVCFKPTIKSEKIESESDNDLFMEFYEECFKSCSETGIRVLTFNIPLIDEHHQKNIYCMTRSLLDVFIEEPINPNELDADLPPRAICLGISKVLSHKFMCQHEFYIQFSSILHRMNQDGLYQEARDFAEEALICSHKYQELHFGYYAKFTLYSKQMNIIDSLLNCCLLLTSLCNQDRICNELIKRVYVEIFIALRTFNFFDYAKKIYTKTLVNIDIDEFERQKCDLAMFYLRLMEGDRSVIDSTEEYIKKNQKSIEKYRKSSLIPWFSYICNLKELFGWIRLN